MNVKLLRRVQALMKKYPEHVGMENWVVGDLTVDKAYGPSCGTTACIAGWVQAAETGVVCEHAYYDVEETARWLLDINENDARKLFYLNAWPQDLRGKYYLAGTDSDLASIVCERIDRFIEEYRC